GSFVTLLVHLTSSASLSISGLRTTGNGDPTRCGGTRRVFGTNFRRFEEQMSLETRMRVHIPARSTPSRFTHLIRHHAARCRGSHVPAYPTLGRAIFERVEGLVAPEEVAVSVTASVHDVPLAPGASRVAAGRFIGTARDARCAAGNEQAAEHPSHSVTCHRTTLPGEVGCLAVDSETPAENNRSDS